MKKTIALFVCALSTAPAIAQEGRFVTFKTVQDKWGKTEHQVDRNTIKQEGAYKTFWSRIWKPKDKQPVAISSGGQLFIWSRKFAVDCANRRFAGQFIDSTDIDETKRKANLQTVRWTGLDKNPAVNRAVCEGR
jgi:hypothetical protein